MTDKTFQRFISKLRFVEFDDELGECWVWTGARQSSGYGHLWIDGRDTLAHRAAYEHWCGPIKPECEIDHLCRNKLCVNPRHIEAVTASVNCQRGLAPIHMAVVGRSMKGRRVVRSSTHVMNLRAARRSPEYRERMSAILKRRFADPETRSKMRASQSRRAIHPMTGKSQTVESRDKIAAAMTLRWASKRATA